jgi:hypothetical protein
MPRGVARSSRASARSFVDAIIEFQAAGVAFRQTLKTEPWGARAFIVEDPDGNLLCFAGMAP